MKRVGNSEEAVIKSLFSKSGKFIYLYFTFILENVYFINDLNLFLEKEIQVLEVVIEV